MVWPCTAIMPVRAAPLLESTEMSRTPTPEGPASGCASVSSVGTVDLLTLVKWIPGIAGRRAPGAAAWRCYRPRTRGGRVGNAANESAGAV
jgi:hypothetical protein